MSDPPRKVLVVFYRTPGGSEVVRDWLKGLDRDDREAIGNDLMRVQFRWPVGMPLCRSLGSGLWEVRSDLPGNRIARVLFCIVANGSWRCTASSRRRRRHRMRTSLSR